MGDTPPVYCKGLAVDFFARFFLTLLTRQKVYIKKNRVTKYERDTIKLYIRIVLT